MAAFRSLAASELVGLADYVRFLAVRGATEQALVEHLTGGGSLTPDAVAELEDEILRLTTGLLVDPVASDEDALAAAAAQRIQLLDRVTGALVSMRVKAALTKLDDANAMSAAARRAAATARSARGGVSAPARSSASTPAKSPRRSRCPQASSSPRSPCPTARRARVRQTTVCRSGRVRYSSRSASR